MEFGAAVGDGDAAVNEREAMATAQIWFTRCPVPTALGLAVRLGALRQDLESRGVGFSAIQDSKDPTIRLSHFTHSLANSIRHGGNTPAIYARSHGADTRVVALSWTRAPHPILTLPASGIRSVKDLKGRRLGVPRRENDPIDFWRATTLRAYETALATEGLTVEDVTLVDLPIARTYIEDGRWKGANGGERGSIGGDLQRREVFALIRGEVDAIFSQSSFATELAGFIGATTIYDVARHPVPLERANNDLPDVFTVSRGLIDAHFETVATILAYTVLAGEWAAAHNSAAVRLFAAEQGVAEDTFRTAYGPTVTEQLDIDLSPFRRAALAQRGKFLQEHGFIETDVDIDAWIDPRPLNRARELVAEWTKAGTIPLVLGSESASFRGDRTQPAVAGRS